MKKVFRTLAAIATVAMATSCANDETTSIAAQQAEAPVVAQVKNNVEHNGRVVIDCAAATAAPKSRAALTGGIIDNVRPAQLDATTMKELNDLFMAEFPAGAKNLEADHSALDSYSSSFSFISDGTPVTIYPVMVGGNAKNTLSVFWYEGGDMKTQEIWALTEPSVLGSASNGWSCIQDGQGITLNIPKGSPYGFSITNPHEGGTRVQGKPFSTDATQNANNDLHAVTYNKDGKTFIGFEDLDYKFSKCDFDFNDIILMMTPAQTMSPGIEIDTDEDFTCVSDDFNINLGDKGYEAIPTTQKTEPFEFNGVIDIKNYNPVLNGNGELVFKIRLYKDATPWKNDYNWKYTPEECLTEPLSASSIKGIPSGYELVSLTKTKAYESTSNGAGIVPYLQIDAILKKK